MPGLLLTVEQATRLFNLAPDECWQVLDRLRRDGVIEATVAGQYRLTGE
jgi:hypothetical protein